MTGRTAVCKTDSFGNFTQYKRYLIIDVSGSKIKVEDDFGDIRWIEDSVFYIE